MRRCPVCHQKTESLRCPTCGFDASQDYEHFPTLTPTMSIAARRKAWLERQQAQAQKNRELNSQPAHTNAEAAAAAGRSGKKILRIEEWPGPKNENPRAERKKQKNRLYQTTSFIYLICSLIVLLSVYGLLTLGHFALFHVPSWNPAPCEPHFFCSIFICAPEEYHQWNDPGCLEPQTCINCGAQQGGTDSHVWCDADHDGIELCHICSTDRGNPYAFRCTAYAYNISVKAIGKQTTITFLDESEVPSGPITMLDYTTSTFHDYTYTLSGNIFTLTFSGTPAEGKYTIYTVVDAELVPIVDLFFGEDSSPIPVGSELRLTDFRAQNLLTGRYLKVKKDTFTTSVERNWRDAPSFSGVSDLDIRTEDDLASAATLPNYDGNEKLICERYYMINRDDQPFHFYVFKQYGQYLAVDPSGTVYWSDELTDECYWLIHTREDK